MISFEKNSVSVKGTKILVPRPQQQHRTLHTHLLSSRIRGLVEAEKKT